MSFLLNLYRKLRVLVKQIVLVEPIVTVRQKVSLEFHGNNYCGWAIPVGRLNSQSVVVDIGLGEDISFSRSLMQKYGLKVHGFDPTPRSINYVRSLKLNNFELHSEGVGSKSGIVTFYLPKNEEHVSGSVIKEEHLGVQEMEVNLLSMDEVMKKIGSQRIDLLKMDIEGAEYDVINSESFKSCAERIGVICIEFHHRWKGIGKDATNQAVRKLKSLGFECAWRSWSTNEEFLFIRSEEK